MYKLLIVLIVFLNHNQCVQCSFLKFMSEQFRDIKDTFAYAFNRIFHHLGNALTKTTSTKRKFRYYWTGNLITLPPTIRPLAQLAASHGRVLETHVVYTQDGYILSLHRLSLRRVNEKPLDHRTVLLHHGLQGSSADWLLLGPNKSLPYLLSDAGYDVWLANARGNCYSRSHVFKNPDFREFWNFSWQEMGEYDLPAILHYIEKVTQSDQPINYVGHSMGATALLVLLSMKPEYNKYFRIAILLAPLAIMNHAQGPLKILAKTLEHNPPSVFRKLQGIGEYLPSWRFPSGGVEKFCSSGTMLCRNSLLFTTGKLLQEGSMDANFITRLLYHVPAGGSTDTILHYAQLIKDKKFHKFGNESEEFQLKDITVPIIIFTSTDDWLSTVADNDVLYIRLGNPLDHIIIENENVSHTEFVWGSNADKLIFSKIIDFIDKGPDVNNTVI